jgi:hypothetical protein
MQDQSAGNENGTPRYWLDFYAILACFGGASLVATWLIPTLLQLLRFEGGGTSGWLIFFGSFAVSFAAASFAWQVFFTRRASRRQQ